MTWFVEALSVSYKLDIFFLFYKLMPWNDIDGFSWWKLALAWSNLNHFAFDISTSLLYSQSHFKVFKWHFRMIKCLNFECHENILLDVNLAECVIDHDKKAPIL